MTDTPDQPDGIESDSFDLPLLNDAAERVRAYLSEFGDGLVDSTVGTPLYARDLQVLANQVDDAPSNLRRLMDSCILLRDSLAETTRERDEARAEATEQSDKADDWCARFEAAEGSRRDWAADNVRLEVELERERRITSAYAEQVRIHLCSAGKPLTEPADPDKEWTLEELSGTVCGKTGEFTPDVCDGTCSDCQPRQPFDPTDDDDAGSVHPDSNGGA